MPTGAFGASWRNVSWCAGCVVAVVAGVLGRSMAGVVQRGDVPRARSGLIWGLRLVSFVLMAGFQLRAEGRRGLARWMGEADQHGNLHTAEDMYEPAPRAVGALVCGPRGPAAGWGQGTSASTPPELAARGSPVVLV